MTTIRPFVYLLRLNWLREAWPTAVAVELIKGREQRNAKPILLRSPPGRATIYRNMSDVVQEVRKRTCGLACYLGGFGVGEFALVPLDIGM